MRAKRNVQEPPAGEDSPPAPGQPIILISCGAQKARHACQAWALYTGPLFKAQLSWALSVTDQRNVFILSAKHGLMPLRRLVGPYDVRMGQRGSITGEELRQQAGNMHLRERPVLMLAGQEYVKVAREAFPNVVELAEATGCDPRMGMRLQWMKRNAGKMPQLRRCA